MKTLLFLALSFCVVGCGTNPIRIQPPGSEQPIIEINPRGYGRMCSWVTFEQKADGTTSVDYVLAQDGTSDWSVSRLLAYVSDVVASLPIVGSGERKAEKMESSSMIEACAQLVGRVTEE